MNTVALDICGRLDTYVGGLMLVQHICPAQRVMLSHGELLAVSKKGDGSYKLLLRDAGCGADHQTPCEFHPNHGLARIVDGTCSTLFEDPAVLKIWNQGFRQWLYGCASMTPVSAPQAVAAYITYLRAMEKFRLPIPEQHQ